MGLHFGATALATATLKLAQKDGKALAVVFIAANLLIGTIALRSAYGGLRGLAGPSRGSASPA